MNKLLHLFLPRESNNHRAKFLHNKSLLLIIALLLASQFFVSQTRRHAPAVLGVAANISVDDLLRITNQDRQANGLPPLRLDGELMQAAAGKAQDMFVNNYWAHISPSGTTPWDFIKGAGYNYLYAGENLARGYDTADSVVNAWMNSPSHRENMLSPNYQDVGFAIKTGTLTGDETVLVVEEFGKRYIAGEPAVATSNASPPPPTPVSYPTSSPVISPVIAKTEFTPTPSPAPAQVNEATVSGNVLVASFNNKPFIDSKSLTHNMAVIVISLFVMILLLDLVIIERRKIIRVASHNVDHLIYLAIILAVVFIFGRGVIL